MKDPLQRFTIAVTGDFGPQRGHEKIRQWVEANGGTFAFHLGPEVTHLICSRKHFKRGVAMVREARKIDGLAIVNFDWLEDSLMKMYPRKETSYLLHRQIQATAKAKRAKKAVRKAKIQKAMNAFEKGCQDFRTEMFSDGYHIYRDSTTFPYQITLARANLIANQNERYHLKLYESHTEPSLYATYVTFSAPAMPVAKHILAPIGSSFDTALFAFTTFFKLKTKKEWEERLFTQKEGGRDGNGEKDEEDEEEEDEDEDEEAFVYTPPEEGEPRGV